MKQLEYKESSSRETEIRESLVSRLGWILRDMPRGEFEQLMDKMVAEQLAGEMRGGAHPTQPAASTSRS